MTSGPGKQYGQTLVGMMVGLVISLITIAAMLVLYKSMVEVSGQASADSLRDGQVASALLAAQMDVHEAGYGIGATEGLADAAAGAAIDDARRQAIGQAAIAVNAADKRIVVWRSNVDGTAPACTRLQIVPGTDRSVRLLRQGPTPCASTTGVSSWPSATVLLANAAPWQQRDGSVTEDAAAGTYLDMPADDADSGFRVLSAADELCTQPYAQQSADIQTYSPRLVLEKNGRELFSVCLSNIVATRAAATPPAEGAPATGAMP